MVGSTRTQTDGAGVVVARFDYEAFGEVSQQAGSAAADELHRFTGKPMDGTGLYYFNARYMDPEIGRFISRDPAVDGANWWVYCYNKPLAFIDPDGEIPFCIITGGIGALIGAGYEAFMSWRETGGIAWDRVGKGAVIGGAIGLGFGAGSTFLCTGSFTGTASQLWLGTGKVVLWSGGGSLQVREIAKQYANMIGSKVLEQTLVGKLLHSMEMVGNRVLGNEKTYEVLRPLWENASAAFVRSAQGEIHIFLNAQGISDLSIFYTVEWSICKELGLRIIWHFVQ